ncbi:hypothetical protein [Fictibacillus sp. S7]|uniref:hypothetical protein n=1 Tax=Fictibacillus sp. S7 TaxID=2212476 RepID=UPI001024DB7F|nr:hypothetical protein [Fictibacillus sp. S7]RXZ02214.1 hypothetical protein DMO16_22685 [Fictibacillus sp. S7]
MQASIGSTLLTKNVYNVAEFSYVPVVGLDVAKGESEAHVFLFIKPFMLYTSTCKSKNSIILTVVINFEINVEKIKGKASLLVRTQRIAT